MRELDVEEGEVGVWLLEIDVAADDGLEDDVEEDELVEDDELVDEELGAIVLDVTVELEL